MSVRRDYLPFVSVVMPTLNSERTLEKCLESVFSQDYPKDKLEIILIDGGSKDRTLEIGKKYPVRIVVDEKKGRGSAYNKSIAEVKSEAIAFLDSDAYAEPLWLREIASELMKEPSIAAVYCCQKAPSDSSFLQRCIDTVCYKRDRTGHANGVIYKTDLLLKAKGFNEGLNYLQEDELEHRFLKSGYQSRNIEKVLVLHYPRKTLKDYISQNIEAGTGSVMLYDYTKDKKVLLDIVCRTIVLFIPTIFLSNMKYALIALPVLASIYILYIAYKTHKDYHKLRYLLAAPFITYSSLIGNFIGYFDAIMIKVKCRLNSLQKSSIGNNISGEKK